MTRSKKGVIEDAGFWIFRIIQIMIVVFAVVFFVNSIIKENIDTGNLELELITARVINSPYCLAKTELDTGRIYPGIIILERYDESRLKEECLVTDEKNAYISVKIALEGSPVIYINKEYYEDIEPLTFSSKYQKAVKNLPVIVESEKGRETKSLEIVAVGRKR